ncbi:MAG: hypothetical protein PHQ40_20805 [Anaerolineaceae bacterium]|nr:hypothetical protein [Anaerolineaceae bacterium]
MFEKIPRRSFLKVMLGLFAFVPAVRVLTNNVSQNQDVFSVEQVNTPETLPPPPPPGHENAVIENYASGTFVEDKEGDLLIHNRNGDTLLHLLASTNVWEGAFVKEIPMKKGDWLIAWGKRKEDRSLDVELLWVNLVNLRGIITNPSQSGEEYSFELKDRQSGNKQVRIHPLTEAVSKEYPGKEPYKDRPIDIHNGQFCQVIGRELEDGDILATDLYLD